MRKLLMFALLIAAPGWGQSRDFLNADEVDQLRVTQEPNDRLQLYTKFALRRIDEIEKQMKDGKAGRSAFVHDLLEDYTEIIEAIDTVADDALRRKILVDIGTAAAAKSEKDFLERLEKIRDGEPKDLGRYEFALRQAIETTEDSMESNQQDLQQRAKDVLGKLEKEKEERAKEMVVEGGETKAKGKEEQPAAAPAKPKRKPPTLRRPGEPDPADTPLPKKR